MQKQSSDEHESSIRREKAFYHSLTKEFHLLLKWSFGGVLVVCRGFFLRSIFSQGKKKRSVIVIYVNNFVSFHIPCCYRNITDYFLMDCFESQDKRFKTEIVSV